MVATDEDVIIEDTIKVYFGSYEQFKSVMSGIRSEYPKRFNRYGTNPNGYAYTCGHEWDCCGCLNHTGRREYEFSRIGKLTEVKILLDVSRNY